MSQLKSQIYTDAKLDLSLYIEGLLRIDEPLNDADQIVRVAEVDAEAVNQESSILSGQIDCLQVFINGLPFLIPTSYINQVKKINQNITRLPVEANAFLGLIKLEERSVAVIDLITLVCESNRKKTTDMQVRDNFIQHILLMEQGRYAIACDKPGELCKLDTDDVQISQARNSHRFYHGIAKSRLCPVINMDRVNDAIADMPFIQTLARTANHCQ